MTTLMEQTFWNPVELFVFESVHNNLKLYWYGVLLKMRSIFFAPISFEIQQTDNWTDNIQLFGDIISIAILVENIARCELTWLKCKWTRKWKWKGVDITHSCQAKMFSIFLLLVADLS